MNVMTTFFSKRLTRFISKILKREVDGSRLKIKENSYSKKCHTFVFDEKGQEKLLRFFYTNMVNAISDNEKIYRKEVQVDNFYEFEHIFGMYHQKLCNDRYVRYEKKGKKKKQTKGKLFFYFIFSIIV